MDGGLDKEWETALRRSWMAGCRAAEIRAEAKNLRDEEVDKALNETSVDTRFVKLSRKFSHTLVEKLDRLVNGNLV